MLKVRKQLEKADKLGRDGVKGFYELCRDGKLNGILRLGYGDTFIDRIHERAEAEGIKDEWEKESTPLIDVAISKVISYFRIDKSR